MPSALIYLGIMLVVVILWFAFLKRPVYEAIFVSFIVLIAITKSWQNIWAYIEKGISTNLIYSMVAFVCMSQILTKTKIIDGCISIILAVLGRVTGGAGYVSVIASSFMGALSGSGPGNVMATGTITIPAMIKSGFPPELAANIESNSSYLGNMIPPSSNIVAALGAYLAVCPDSDITMGQFWVVLWGIALWFVAQRVIMVWAFCKYYKVKPISQDELPDLAEVLKNNWKGLFLPVVILVPFLLDYLFKDSFFTSRLGETGAKYISNSLLIFIGGLASFYTCIITSDKSVVTPRKLAKMFSNGVKTISPAIGVCIIGYMVGALFSDFNVAEDMERFILSMEFGKFGMVVFISVVTCFLGMVIPGSSLVVIFGPVFIYTLSASGVNAMLAAAMLPCVCGVMCGITPPLGLGMYAGMSLAQSDFSKTFKNNLWWVAGQFFMEITVLMGWLPILGM